MFGRAPHEHLIRLARDPHCRIGGEIFPKAALWVKLFAGLVKDSWYKVCALFHLALIRCDLPHQHFQKRGFANPVWTDKGNPIPALNGQRKTFCNDLIFIGFVYFYRIDHLAPRFRTGGKFHGGGALAADHGRALCPKVLECAQAALVSFAPRADAFNGPAAFGFDFALHFVALNVFFFP